MSIRNSCKCLLPWNSWSIRWAPERVQGLLVHPHVKILDRTGNFIFFFCSYGWLKHLEGGCNLRHGQLIPEAILLRK